MTQYKQEGFISLGVISIILLLGIITVLTIKVVPSYLDDFAISKVLVSLHDKSNIPADGSATDKVLSKLKLGLDTNSIRLAEDELSMRSRNGVLEIDIKYQRRFALFFNWYLVLMFDHNGMIKLSEI